MTRHDLRSRNKFTIVTNSTDLIRAVSALTPVCPDDYDLLITNHAESPYLVDNQQDKVIAKLSATGV